VILLSDFLDETPVAPWRELARRWEILAARVVDPLENELHPGGLIRIGDPETGQVREIQTSSRRLARAYARRASWRRDRFRDWCTEARVVPLELTTAESPVDQWTRFLSDHATRRRLVR
jgi:hypothetical protein